MGNAGIILCFDDYHVKEWYEFLPSDAKATFYISNHDKLTTKDWDMLKELQDLGSLIGHHGFNHRRAGTVHLPVDDPRRADKDNDFYESWEAWLRDEIYSGFEQFKKHGFTVKDYAYPRGNCSPQTHVLLKKVFRSLRIGGVGIYNRSLFPDIFCASAFDIVPKNEYSGHEKEVIRAFEKGMVVCVHMHHAQCKKF